MELQQELMRHASIQTTMNVCGQAMTSSKCEAPGGCGLLPAARTHFVWPLCVSQS